LAFGQATNTSIIKDKFMAYRDDDIGEWLGVYVSDAATVNVYANQDNYIRHLRDEVTWMSKEIALQHNNVRLLVEALVESGYEDADGILDSITTYLSDIEFNQNKPVLN